MFTIRNILKLLRTNRHIVKYSSSAKETSSSETSIKYLASRKLNKQGYLDEEDQPLKYLASPARLHKAKVTRTGIKQERLWYEPHVVTICILVFLIYFTVLREENDLDQELRASLYDRIEGLEETQLKLSLNYNQEKGLDTSAITKRLEEIKIQKEMSTKASSSKQ